jgi:hypothetical protein
MQSQPTKLSSFPSNVLSDITGHLTGYDITRLWFCGDARLCKAMKQGGVLKFEVFHRFLRFWPNLISEFDHLASLHVELAQSDIIDDIAGSSTPIPGSLTSLCANAAIFETILLSSPEVLQKLLHLTILDEYYFPSPEDGGDVANWSLQTLKWVTSEENTISYPVTLTSLELSYSGFGDSEDLIDFSHLTQLTQLKMIYVQREHRYPDSLQYLSTDFQMEAEHIKHLPRANLTHLSYAPLETTNIHLDLLPRSLRTLHWRCEGDNVPECEMEDDWIAHLPLCLENFQVDAFFRTKGEDLKKLSPTHLKSLHIRELSISDSSNLEEQFISLGEHSLRSIAPKGDILPNVLSFKAEGDTDSLMNCIWPSSLKTLESATRIPLCWIGPLDPSQDDPKCPKIARDNLVRYPPSLETLSISISSSWEEDVQRVQENSITRFIPLNLHTLSIEIVGALNLHLLLNPQLQVLKIAIRSLPNTLLDTMKQLNGNWFQALPQTLQVLKLDGHHESWAWLSNEQYKLNHLTNLKELDTKPIRFSLEESLLQFLPASLQKLRVSFEQKISWTKINLSYLINLRECDIQCIEGPIDLPPDFLEVLPSRLVYFCFEGLQGYDCTQIVHKMRSAGIDVQARSPINRILRERIRRTRVETLQPAIQKFY